MIVVSNDFKTAMTRPIKEIQAFIDSDTTSIRDENDLISFKVSGDGGLCKSVMRKLEAQYLGEHNLLGKWVTAGFGVKLASGAYEYINYGSFLVNELTITKDTGITNIVAYDKMINAMIPYDKLEVEYPIKLIDYSRLLCEACSLELGNNIFGTNICPSNVNNWEMGHYNLSGEKEENGARCRLKDLIPVKPDTEYYVNTYSSKTTYNFVIRGYDKNKNFITSYGACPTGTILNTDNVYYLGIGMYDYSNEINGEGQIILESIESGDTKPFICLTSETDKSYAPYNAMNDWQITQDLWENIDGITYRDIFVQIAQATGSTCIIGNDDKVYFKPITNTGEQLTYDNMFKLKLEDKYGEINSVVLSRTPQEDNIYLRDEESVHANGITEFKIENNEIIDKDRDNAIVPIFNALKGISYYPFETTTEGLGWYEIGDSFNIVSDTGDVFNTALFNFSITIDGSVKETLKAVAETKTQTQYQYATSIAKRVKNTEIIVNKQDGEIRSLVSDMYDENGVSLNQKYTELLQDIDKIVASVQNSGGNNLIKDSVMFAYANRDKMTDEQKKDLPWELDGDGKYNITSDTESLHSGGLSGHSFTLLNKKARQTIQVKTSGEENTCYTFSTKIKKEVTGSCYVKLYNSSEEHIIEIPDGASAYYTDYEIKGILPKENYYIIEFYGSADSNATFTDNMFAVGEYKSQWTQASGEVMNTQVNINVDGVLVKSSVYVGDYTVMSPLEFAGYSIINGTPTRVFSLNKDVTEVQKLLAKDEIKMLPIKVVPVTEGESQGWAFVPSS